MTAPNAGTDRLPPIAMEQMNERQRKSAQALIAGPRGPAAIQRGPFVPLLRSPELMDRLQRVGEYLRFDSALPARIGEFVTLIVAREWTQQFEWAAHVPLARKAGVATATIDALAEGRRPDTMAGDEALAYDFCVELLRTRGVCDATWSLGVARFGETGVLDLVGLIGYFITIDMVLNVAHTPGGAPDVAPLAPLPR
jgi:4-carboxymuconolactone decarboxylase